VLTRDREIRVAGERWRRKLARKGKRRDLPAGYCLRARYLVHEAHG
jgi:hypothetical protein